jgi:hypothetical protein
VALDMLLLYHGPVPIRMLVEVTERFGLTQGHDKKLDVGEIPPEERHTCDRSVRQKFRDVVTSGGPLLVLGKQSSGESMAPLIGG